MTVTCSTTWGTNVYEKCKKYDAFGFVARQKAEGKIRQVGMSFHDRPELLDEILAQYGDKLDFVQLQINYADWEQPNVQSRRCLEVARQYGKPVTVMEPCKGGTLVKPARGGGRLCSGPRIRPRPTPPGRCALPASQEGVTRVLSGMNTLEQVADNANLFRHFTPITKEEQGRHRSGDPDHRAEHRHPLHRLRLLHHGLSPRTSPFPNTLRSITASPVPRAAFPATRLYYHNTSLTHGKASACIGCGQCETACPQHLPIRRLLGDVAAKFETGAAFPTKTQK